MSKSLNIGAIVLAIAFASGSSVEPLTVDRMASAAQASIPGSPRDVEAIQQIVTTFDQALGLRPGTSSGKNVLTKRAGGVADPAAPADAVTQ